MRNTLKDVLDSRLDINLSLHSSLNACNLKNTHIYNNQIRRILDYNNYNNMSRPE